MLCTTDEKSFLDVRNWLVSLQQNTGPISMILVGNKSDLVDKKVVDTSRGEALAKEMGVPFFEASAKNSDNVEEAFLSLIREVVKAQEAAAGAAMASEDPAVVGQSSRSHASERPIRVSGTLGFGDKHSEGRCCSSS
eukprot:TRINITY_DN2813_c0_g1_i1.p1 TRINITY_DN2813_c0_g1~~TRINITY_DN2813_c0_g1_i1.p1  ORF type:complete len:137 (-),score=20.01 TRINITY_DN2813_c0_g1_i1:138-548(-)